MKESMNFPKKTVIYNGKECKDFIIVSHNFGKKGKIAIMDEGILICKNGKRKTIIRNNEPLEYPFCLSVTCDNPLFELINGVNG